MVMIVVPTSWLTEAWIVGYVNPVDVLGYPLLLLGFGSALILLCFRPQLYVPAVILGIGSFALYELAYLQVLIFRHDLLDPSYTATSVMQWLPLVYVTLFLFLQRRIARILSIAFFLTFAIPPIVYGIVDPAGLQQDELFPIYLQILSCHPFYILTLTCIEMVHKALIRANTQVESIHAIAAKDFLTGVPNRRTITALLQALLAEDGKQGKRTAFVLADIDRFKSINDTFGHQVGDDVLVAFAQILQKKIEGIATLGRWGGEEFVLVVPDTDAERVQRLAEHLRGAIADRSFPKVGHITASFGIAIVRPEETMAEAIERADVALYEAKQSGRNRVCLAENCEPERSR